MSAPKLIPVTDSVTSYIEFLEWLLDGTESEDTDGASAIRELVSALRLFRDQVDRYPMTWPMTTLRGERGLQKAVATRSASGAATKAKVEREYLEGLKLGPKKPRGWHVQRIARRIAVSERTVRRHMAEMHPIRKSDKS